MRHGKAEPFAESDHERALTERGIRSAADAGGHLAEVGHIPDYAIVSSSARTRRTWAEVAEACGSGAVVAVDDAVYSGSSDIVLEAIRAVPADAGVVIFVGHNPSAASVANELDDGDGDQAAIDEMLHGFPAGALAVFEIGVTWQELGSETGRLVDFYVGRD